MAAGCTGKPAALTAKVSKTCSCFLTPTATRTVTVTATSVKNAGVPAAVTATATAVGMVTTQSCSSTTTTTVYEGGGGMTCGVPLSSYTSSFITCSNIAAPSATNARFRIEGNEADGTIFEGCIASGPRDITTPSGGTHKCDGTNNNANPNPGATLSTQIDEAARQFEFDYDGTYSNQFQDFLINRIGYTASTGSHFWGVLSNEIFTPTGGCQIQSRTRDRGLWAFDVFAPNRMLLMLSPDYVAVAPGPTVTVTVSSVNPNNGAGFPFAGATLSDKGTSDANGQVTFTAPTERGSYVLKVIGPNKIRSNAFYLSVF